ncbi:hypothetical protein C7H19_02805 [Aphanothece hegewaldii CCALA 016]|uniref:Uncharacterized protein n=1 Tax=Aphanothece hegewaldii CCALA 016 TaxID=2107694 RepID=A0A2T1M2M4_9CHRO|nr:hypothetical protein [Aphanothece hegewaldii]PSF38999.1 hypothetical protein C7H19_02805 [Aphanothece hegewaldii CCALA 016]
MTKLETFPLSDECLEGFAKTMAKFFAPYEDKEPSAKTPRRISPEIAERLEIEIKVIDPLYTTDQKASCNDSCIKEMQDLMDKYFEEHKIPPETIAAFPSDKCLEELVGVISDFFMEYKIEPETVDSLEIVLKYQSETQEGIMAVRTGCIPGGPPYSPCPQFKTIGLIR